MTDLIPTPAPTPAQDYQAATARRSRLARRGQPAARLLPLDSALWQPQAVDGLPPAGRATAGAHSSGPGRE